MSDFPQPVIDAMAAVLPNPDGQRFEGWEVKARRALAAVVSTTCPTCSGTGGFARESKRPGPQTIGGGPECVPVFRVVSIDGGEQLGQFGEPPNDERGEA